jgi:hypothetical protein
VNAGADAALRQQVAHAVAFGHAHDVEMVDMPAAGLLHRQHNACGQMPGIRGGQRAPLRVFSIQVRQEDAQDRRL